MTDCSQISTQLVNALQQKSELPKNTEAYCREEADGDINLYKECLNSQSTLRLELDSQIAGLENEMGICSALIGTWTWQVEITDPFGISHTVTQTLTITSWDTQGPWSGTIVSSEIAGMQLTQDIANPQDNAVLNETTLLFSFILFPTSSTSLYYFGTLNMQVQPHMIGGGYLTASSGQVIPWSATKS